jgi:hypothetical protein
MVDTLIFLLKNIFKERMDEEDLKKVFYNNAVLDIDDNDKKETKYYIQKNNTKILLGKVKKPKSKANKNWERDKKKFEEYGKLPNLLECIFKIKLSNYDEPLLLSGPTCYKTYAAKMILRKADVVSLNQESTIPQLLGASFFYPPIEDKKF